MVEHAARAHSDWSASSTNRNWNCAGALAVVKTVEHLEIENEAAAWGTACHQVSEKALTAGVDAYEYLETIETTKSFEFEVDDEMAETAQQYIDYVRERLAEYKEETGDDAVLMIEQRFKLDKLKPPFEAGGTADAVIFYPKWRMLEIIDLKTGRGVVVEVNDNKQLRTYAVGAMLANSGLDVDTIKSTIVQTRAGHKDGSIRSEVYPVTDLVEWTSELLKAMKRSKTAYNEFNVDKPLRSYKSKATQIEKVKERFLVLSDWSEKYLTAGDHCTFCPAASFCPSLEKKALDKANLFFDDLDGTPTLSVLPGQLDLDRLIDILDAAPLIEGFLSACRGMAHKLADSGVEIKNSQSGAEYILVDKVGRRRWNVDEKQLKKLLPFMTDLEPEAIYNQKLKSPAQLEKALGGKKRHALIEGLWSQPITGTNLVRTDKTTRKAITPSVQKHFDILE